MKKKIIIASAVLVVLAGGLGIPHIVRTRNAAQTSSNKEFFYNEENSNGEIVQPTEDSIILDENQLPSRDEVITTPDSIYCLVNKEYSLPSDYEPDDLIVPNITFSIDYESEKKYIRKEAAEALEQMFADAAKENLELVAVSGYRSYTRQEEIYEKNLKTRGTTHTNQYSAKPGYSEHQTGLVMDISCKSEGYDLQESFGDTPEGEWVAKNACSYGYIIRYPKDKSEITGYAFEPWHLRYVGVPLATYLTENNLTLDEYFYYEPSYNFITDESEYINDTPENYTYSSTPSTMLTPATTNTNQNTSVSVSTKPSRVPITSKAPVTTTEPTTPTPEATTQIPTENTTVAPTQEPVASAPTSTEPSKAPAVEPSVAPSQAPTTVPPTVVPPSESTGEANAESEDLSVE